MRPRRGKRQRADGRPEAGDRPEIPVATPGPAVELRDVRRQYGRGAGTVHALAGIDLALPRGTFTAVMGPSGSGRSTFLQCAAGLDRPTAGSVCLGGTEITGMSGNELTALGEITDASGYATEQNRDAKLGVRMNNTMAAVLGGFAAVAAVNTLVMTVLDRRRELGTLRLVGSTRRQVMAMLRWEALLVSVVGLVLGSAIAAATLIPMMGGVTGDMPYVPPMVYGSFAAAVGGLTLLAVTLPARAALRRWS
ncbi:FtsX-like permease family protein [Streptomyces nitrosporeus]|uniref:FtsX-like permease family protein n=1 Tax=Streptomyces nitrosporeus TaxID=28894 RepID=UPI0033347729